MSSCPHPLVSLAPTMYVARPFAGNMCSALWVHYNMYILLCDWSWHLPCISSSRNWGPCLPFNHADTHGREPSPGGSPSQFLSVQWGTSSSLSLLSFFDSQRRCVCLAHPPWSPTSSPDLPRVLPFPGQDTRSPQKPHRRVDVPCYTTL
jgi:hypothetical protein